jgi:hypothetical protein
MPGFWKATSVEDRHECMLKMDAFHADTTAEPGTTPRSNANCWELTKYCRLDHLLMLWAAYLMARCDGSAAAMATTTTTTAT